MTAQGEGGALDRVWYHVFPLGALEAERHNPSPGAVGGTVAHRLGRLTADLDRIADLGVQGLMLGPVFESESHGYDTVDPFRIDRRLGDEEDLVELADACRARGLVLGLDAVFHHVGRQHPRFQDVLREGPSSPSARWFHIDPSAAGPDGFGYANFEGHRALVKLRHDEPEVEQWAIDTLRYWQDRGVGAWRIDAAYAIPSPFLRRVTDAGRDHRPGTAFVGEVIHGDYVGFSAAAGLDAVTQYELWKAIWSSLNDRNLFELAWALERHQGYARSVRPWTFIGNHDTTHIASKLHDRALLPHAIALLLALPGTPAVYAGDEVGAEGVKREEEWGDDEVRRPPPPVPDGGPGRELWELHRHLIRVRRDHAWLSTAAVRVDQLANESAVVTLTGEGGVAHLALALGDKPLAAPSGATVAGAAGDEVPARGWSLRIDDQTMR